MKSCVDKPWMVSGRERQHLERVQSVPKDEKFVHLEMPRLTGLLRPDETLLLVMKVYLYCRHIAAVVQGNPCFSHPAFGHGVPHAEVAILVVRAGRLHFVLEVQESGLGVRDEAVGMHQYNRSSHHPRPLQIPPMQNVHVFSSACPLVGPFPPVPRNAPLDVSQHLIVFTNAPAPSRRILPTRSFASSTCADLQDCHAHRSHQ